MGGSAATSTFWLTWITLSLVPAEVRPGVPFPPVPCPEATVEVARRLPESQGHEPQPNKIPAYTESMAVREEAHRLLDEIPEDRLTDAIDMLRQRTNSEPGDIPRRRSGRPQPSTASTILM